MFVPFVYPENKPVSFAFSTFIKEKTGILFMKNSKFIDKTLLLKVGIEYDLEITRIIKIPDSEDYFVGRDKNGLNHLIPVVHYINYNIKPGDIIKCRLDRINCQGRFYFEPEHPVYKKGKSYYFQLSGFTISGCDTSCNVNYIALVKDEFGANLKTEVFQKNTSTRKNPAKILCQVINIKKAKPVLKVTDQQLIG